MSKNAINFKIFRFKNWTNEAGQIDLVFAEDTPGYSDDPAHLKVIPISEDKTRMHQYCTLRTASGLQSEDAAVLWRRLQHAGVTVNWRVS